VLCMWRGGSAGHAPAAFFSSTAVGEVFKINVKLRSCGHDDSHATVSAMDPAASAASLAPNKAGAGCCPPPPGTACQAPAATAGSNSQLPSSVCGMAATALCPRSKPRSKRTARSCGGCPSQQLRPAHLVHSDLHGNDLSGHLGCRGVVLLAKLHDVHTLQTGRRGGAGARGRGVGVRRGGAASIVRHAGRLPPLRATAVRQVHARV